jgi:two-component system, cell cycle response regulator
MDIVARYGGEEFGVILPFAGSDEAYLVAERIRKAFAGVPIPADGEKDIKVTVSIGVSTVHPDTEVIHVEEGSSVIKSADDALYKAKRSGRNRVVIADESGLQKTEPV